MPAYEYECPQCGLFDAQRPMALRNEPCACSDCGAEAPRVIASALRLAALASAQRQAHARNERSAHAPMSAGEYRALRHPAGCSCCGSSRPSATQRAPSGAKAFPSKRPWMISH
jgi:putative FmdB family regulatory protein